MLQREVLLIYLATTPIAEDFHAYLEEQKHGQDFGVNCCLCRVS